MRICCRTPGEILAEEFMQPMGLSQNAVAGVEAGHAGDFGMVIGVDRGAGRAALLGAGADVVVDHLEERQLQTFDLERSRRSGSS